MDEFVDRKNPPDDVKCCVCGQDMVQGLKAALVDICWGRSMPQWVSRIKVCHLKCWRTAHNTECPCLPSDEVWGRATAEIEMLCLHGRTKIPLY